MYREVFDEVKIGRRFGRARVCATSTIMKATTDQRDKLEVDGGTPDADHAAWKRAKIECGLAQAEDRHAMIPIEQIWRDLKLDR